MTLKEKLDALLQHPSLVSRNYEIKWNTDGSDSGSFIASGKNNSKQAIGNIKLTDNKLTIDVQHSTYGVAYLKKAIIDDFSLHAGLAEATELRLNVPVNGSTVTTKQYLDQLKPGDVVDFASTVYYYSVNSDSINCNGWPLRRNFRAEFLRQIKERCGNIDLPAIPYTEFKLL